MVSALTPEQLVAESERHEGRLALKARSLQRKVIERRIRGAPVIGVEVDDLLQHARLCLLEGRPPFDPNGQISLVHYLFRRMEDEVKRVVRDRSENNALTYYSFDNPDVESQLGVIMFAEYRTAFIDIEAINYISRFLKWLSLEHPDLEPLAKRAIYLGYTDCPSQAASLKLPVERVYQLRNRLRNAVASFNTLVVSEAEKNP